MELQFPSDGITAVVGPNGCGKSNIVDAIRWVVGETRSRQLRSSGMKDIIFSGTADRPAQSFAEVSLLIDNSDSSLPSQYSEVQVTRKLIRRGDQVDSQYLLNNQECRLRDIQNLFMDTGLGASSYSIMEMKMIDTLLSDRTEERRSLFEEAAGISKYKQQRKETIRLLEKTQIDLGVVKTDLDSRSRQMRQKEQLYRKAERARELRSQIKQLQLGIDGGRYRRGEAERRRLVALCEEIDERIEKTLRERTVREARVQEFRLSITEEESAYRDQTNAVQAIELSIKDLERERQNILNEKQMAEQNNQRIDEEMKRAEARLLELRQTVSGRDERIEEDARRIAEAEAELEVFKERRVEIQSRIDAVREEEGELQSRLIEVSRRLAEARSHVQLIEGQIATSVGNEEENIRFLEQARSEYERQSQENDRLYQEDGRQSREVEQYRVDQQKFEEEEQLLQEQLNAQLPELELLRSELVNRRAEKEALASLKNGEDEAAQLLMKRFPREQLSPLIEEIHPLPEDAEIVEYCLGEAAQLLLKDEALPINEVLSQLIEEKKGSVWLAERIGEAVSTERLEDGDHWGRLDERIQTEERLRPLISWLLGRYYRVPSAEAAFSLAARYRGKDLWFCAPGPVAVHASGIVRGGKREGEQGALVRQLRLEELIREIGQLEGALSQKQEEKNSVEERLQSVRQQLREIRPKYSNAERELARCKQDYAVGVGRLETLQERMHGLEERLNRVQLESAPLRSQLIEAQKSANFEEENRKQIQAEIDRTAEQRREIELSREEVNEEFNNATRALTRLQGDSKHYTERLGELETELIKLAEQQERDRVLRDENVFKIENSKNKQTEFDEQISAALLRLDEARQALSSVEEAYRARKGGLDDLQDSVLEATKQIAQLEKEKSGYEIKRSENDQRLERLLEEVYNVWEVDLARDDLTAWPEPENLDEANHQLRELQRQQKELGSVNLEFLEDFEEERRRLAEVQAQFDDLDRARLSLERTIDRLDRVARERFRETFEKIRHNFQEVFSGLMAGGEARLALDGDDELEAGIEINARPTGKKMRGVASLSNGERALTAIALLFAIYLVKPSPFCILDEVDAPLDDANIGRFVELLRRFSRQTQFVVVTHNKRTMAAADRLYGVTQEIKGISQIAAVQLDEAASMVN